MHGNGDRRARILEIAVPVIASMLTSAIVVAWTISATLATYHQQLEQHQRLIEANSAEIRALSGGDRTQVGQLAKQEAANDEILRRLSRIENKLDGR